MSSSSAPPLKAGDITTELLADGAVTDAKVNDVATGKLTGTVTNAQLAGSIARSKLSILSATSAGNLSSSYFGKTLNQGALFPNIHATANTTFLAANTSDGGSGANPRFSFRANATKLFGSYDIDHYYLS